MDLAEGADFAVAVEDVAALDEVFVGLGIVESADDGPDGGDGSGDLLDDDGAALVGADSMGVKAGDVIGDGDREGEGRAAFVSRGGVGGGAVDAVEEEGGFWGIGRHLILILISILWVLGSNVKEV